MNRLLRKTLPAMLAALLLAGCVATAPTIEKKEAAAVGAEIPREERVLTPSFFPDRNLLDEGIALLREADRPDQGKARAVFAALIQSYPQSRWRSTAEAFIDLIDTAEAARETDRKKQLLMEQLLTERARTLQENEQLKKTVRELTEKAQAETQALTQENEQLKKDLQRLKALEIELEKRERMLR